MFALVRIATNRVVLVLEEMPTYARNGYVGAEPSFIGRPATRVIEVQDAVSVGDYLYEDGSHHTPIVLTAHDIPSTVSVLEFQLRFLEEERKMMIIAIESSTELRAKFNAVIAINSVDLLAAETQDFIYELVIRDLLANDRAEAILNPIL